MHFGKCKKTLYFGNYLYIFQKCIENAYILKIGVFRCISSHEKSIIYLTNIHVLRSVMCSWAFGRQQPAQGVHSGRTRHSTSLLRIEYSAPHQLYPEPKEVLGAKLGNLFFEPKKQGESVVGGGASRKWLRSGVGGQAVSA